MFAVERREVGVTAWVWERCHQSESYMSKAKVASRNDSEAQGRIRRIKVRMANNGNK